MDPNARHLVKSFQKHLRLGDLPSILEMLGDEETLSVLKREKSFEPFVLAVKSDRLDLFDALLAKGFQLSGRELAEAVKLGNYEAASLLVNLKVSVDSTNYKQIPLQIAYNQYCAERGGLKPDADGIIKLLVKNKANPNIYNQKGLRLVHQITLDKDYDLLKLLIDTYQEEFNLNALTWSKMQNALHLVCEPAKNRTEATCSLLDLKIAKLLIDSNCNLNHRDHQHHETPIFRALVANNFELCRLFVVEGVDLSLRNAYGNDALSRSIQLGRFRIARFLTQCSLAFRAYTCIYKLPSVEDFQRYSASLLNPGVSAQLDDLFDWQEAGLENAAAAAGANRFLTNESFLQYTLSKYDEFLKFLEGHLRQPRRLTDLCRLNVRSYMRKPVSRWASELKLPRQLQDLVMLKDLVE